MSKVRVIYFTMTQLHTASNGGSLCARNHVSRLMQDPGIELLVIAIAAPENCAPTEAYLKSIDVDHIVAPRRSDNIHQAESTIAGALKLAWKAMTHFHYELAALNHDHIGQMVFDWATVHWKADIVVVEYLYSALFCTRLFESSLRLAMITHSREQDYYRDLLRVGVVKHDWLTGAIATRRVGAFERGVYQRCDLVVALGRPDLPPYLPESRIRCITPYLDERAEKWSFADSKSVFFVGHVGHYSNKLALEYIATRLAPLVARKRPDIRFKIVGASLNDVPSGWRNAQLDYLGVADGETVGRLFMSADMLICPIANDFGMKLKIAEAIAYGTPILGNTEALQCIPHIIGLPRFDLARPLDAADLVCDLVGDRDKLTSLSTAMIDQQRVFANSQATIWSDVLREVIASSNEDVLRVRRVNQGLAVR